MMTISDTLHSEILEFLTTGNLEAFNKIRTDRNLDINSINSKGNTFLFSDSISKNVVQMLIEEGINVHHVNNKGKNALFYVNIPVMKMLIKEKVNVNQIDSNNNNCLLNNPRSLTKEKVRVLNKAGIDMNHVDNRKQNILFYLLTNPFIFDLCAKLGSDHHITNVSGTSLYTLIYKGSELDKKFLLLDEFKAKRDKHILLQSMSTKTFSAQNKSRI